MSGLSAKAAGRWRSSRSTRLRPRTAAAAPLAIDSVEEWGVQFGQTLEAAQRQGKTYTFAAVGKSLQAPVTVRLEIERRAKPWDRAAASPPCTLSPDAWTEIHFTFRLEKPFPQGWFAYVSCAQPGAKFRLDQVRLYEGDYVPYQAGGAGRGGGLRRQSVRHRHGVVRAP